MGLWRKLTPDVIEDAVEHVFEQGIWRNLAQKLKEPTNLPPHLGVWGNVMPRPGGIWSELQDETVVIPRDWRDDIWVESNDETLILDRADFLNLWYAVIEGEAAPARPSQPVSTPYAETFMASQKEVRTALWDKVDDETLILSRASRHMWELPNVRNISRYKPRRAPGWALKELETARGEQYYVLKNTRDGSYLRLDERQYYLWTLMDGNQTVQDLAVACFMKYEVLAVDLLVGFLGQLSEKGFLANERVVDVYVTAEEELEKRTVRHWTGQLVQFLVNWEVSLKDADGFFSSVYRPIGPILYNRISVGVLVLLTLAGLPAFFYLNQQTELSVITGATEAVGLGLISLILMQILAIFIHEASHGLTTKHYGRQVGKAGMGLYFGFLSFFVDTSDVWLETRGPRLIVTWAGPFSGFFLSGLASLLILLNPDATWAGLLFQFANWCFWLSFFNLNPLLKLDGYYMLMDWLEIPRLRERSMAFVADDLLPKLRKREAFTREERIFAIFGVMSVGWTLVAIFLAVRFYGRAVYNFSGRIVGEQWAWLPLAVIGLLLLVWFENHQLQIYRRAKAANSELETAPEAT